LLNPPAKDVSIPPDPLTQLAPGIRDAIMSGSTKPVRDGFAWLFPYDPHGQPTIYCEVLHVTEIVLGSDEKINGVAAGDTERWALQPVDNRVLVKPTPAGRDSGGPGGTAVSMPTHYSTNLIVVTTKRTYHMTLVSAGRFMEQVAFYYPEEIRAQQTARRAAMREAAQREASAPPSRPLNFAYTISGPNVAWRPVQAFDDSEHEYIQFPDTTQGADMPVLMVQNGKQQSLVNYQVRGQYYVADRLYHEAALTAGTGTNRQVVRIVGH
jgi:type IV secretion system protein VirB9